MQSEGGYSDSQTAGSHCSAQVCARLGLVSLAYMWRQPQAALLRGMLDAGIQAVLVKVAAMGLEPQRHLGADLASMQTHLHRIRRCPPDRLHPPTYLLSPLVGQHFAAKVSTWGSVKAGQCCRRVRMPP